MTPALHIRRTALTHIVIAKRIRAALLPLMATPVNIASALTLATHPAPIKILQPAGSRAARGSDQAAAPCARVRLEQAVHRVEDGREAGHLLLGEGVDGGGGCAV